MRPNTARLLSPLLRVRWQVALLAVRRVAYELHNAHGRLEPDERRRLGELVRQSGGHPTRLSAPERREVARLAQKAAGLQN